jgi:hypothetical protein
MIDFLVLAGLIGLGVGTIGWLIFMLLTLVVTVCGWAMLFYVNYI